MEALLNIAVSAAQDAGKVIIRHHKFTDRIEVARKGAHDFVTSVDREAEQVIVTCLQRAYPDYGIRTEETSPDALRDSEYQWLVDPLDGTTNFLFGIPHYAVSIALQHHDTLMLGVVYDPFKQELFTAMRGRGAKLNGHRIRARQANSLHDALLATGFPFREGSDLAQYLETLKVLVPDTAGIRRAGSAALDLAYVAAGRFDGFWEFDLNPWDIAAGMVLAQESGALVRQIESDDSPLESGNIIAASPKIMEAMLKRLESLA